MKKILARAIYAVFGKSIEAERAEWRKHCMDMQNELNENNWSRHDWYVDYRTHETNYNWMKHINRGYYVERTIF